MKTAEEKANELLDKLIFIDLDSDIGINTAIQHIILFGKEQDRDTRHACFDELLKLTRYGGPDEPLIILHEAQAACINAKAV